MQDFNKIIKEKCNAQSELDDVDNQLEMFFDAPNSLFKLNDLKKLFKCMKDVLDKVIEGSDLKKDYEQFKQAVKTVLKNDLAKCREIKDTKEKFT